MIFNTGLDDYTCIFVSAAQFKLAMTSLNLFVELVLPRLVNQWIDIVTQRVELSKPFMSAHGSLDSLVLTSLDEV